MPAGKSRSVDIYLRAHDQATRQLQQVDAHTKRMAQSVAKMGTAFMVAGTAVAAGLGLMVRGTMKQILMLHKLRDITGLSAVELQKFGYAAEQQHGSLEGIAKIFPKLSKFMGEAKDGMATYLDEFNKMGVSVVDADGKLRDVKDVFMDMADFMAKEGVSATEKQAVALTLMGRSAMELMSFMMLGSKGIKKLLGDADRFNWIQDETVTRGKAVDDVMTDIRKSMSTLKTTIGTSMIPSLERLAKGLDKVGKWFDELPEGVRKFIGPAMALGAVLLVAGGALMKFVIPMMLLKTLTPGIAGFSAVLNTAMVPALKTMSVALWGALKPILLVIGAVELLSRSVAAAGMVSGKQYELLGKFFKKPGWEAFGKGLQKEMKDIVTAKPLDWLTKGFDKLIGEVNAAELDAGGFGKQLQTQYDQMLKNADAAMQFGDALGQLDSKLKAEQIGLGKFIPAMMEMGRGLKGVFEIGDLIPPVDVDHRRPVQIQVVVYADDSKTVGKMLESQLDKAGAFA